MEISKLFKKKENKFETPANRAIASHVLMITGAMTTPGGVVTKETLNQAKKVLSAETKVTDLLKPKP